MVYYIVNQEGLYYQGGGTFSSSFHLCKLYKSRKAAKKVAQANKGFIRGKVVIEDERL